MKITGTVTKRLYAPGSKSERPAVMVQTDEGEFLLQRAGGNPFRDDVLESLVGKTIRFTAAKKEKSLFMTDWEEIKD